jgi:hypothetical protein
MHIKCHFKALCRPPRMRSAEEYAQSIELAAPPDCSLALEHLLTSVHYLLSGFRSSRQRLGQPSVRPELG